LNKYQNVVLDLDGVPVAGTSVYVYEAGTTNLATLYSDRALTAASNPLTTSALGAFGFYAADGRYDLKISGGGYGPVYLYDVSLQTNVYVARGSATAAEINAGKVFALARTGVTLAMVGCHLQAIGGSAAGATSVDIADTAASPVVQAAFPVAVLTANTVVDLGQATVASLGAAATADKGLQIIKAGANLTGATSVRYVVLYEMG
jgi:hypothetical protein